MPAELIQPSDPRWTEFLDRVPHDIYHLPAFTALSAVPEEGDGRALYVGDERGSLLAPIVVRRIPPHLDPDGSLTDAVSPYGYSTPLFRGDVAAADESLEAVSRAARRVGLVCAFFRLHPLLPLPHDVLRRHGAVVSHGRTVYIDLQEPADDLLRQTRAGHKADLKKLAAAGFSFRIDEWERYETFRELYEQTMERLDAAAYYFFSPDYFRGLREALGGMLHLATVVSPAGEVAAAGLFTEVNGMVQYYLSATAAAFQRLGPSKLMIAGVRDWAKARGNRFFHLGGGLGARNDSLFQFKSGFSRHTAPFDSFRMIFDEGAYRSLCSRRSAEHAPPEGFFPRYRAPLA